MLGDLSTLQEVKDWLGLSSAADDALLTRLITAASEDIRQECNRSFHPADYVEVHGGYGYGQVILVTRQWPVISVASLTVDGAAIAARVGYSASGYVIANGDSASHVLLYGAEFTTGKDNIEIRYRAGYADSHGVFDPPADLAQAAIELVAYRYTGRGRIGQKSKTLAGENVSFITDHYPEQVMRVIQRYKRVIPA